MFFFLLPHSDRIMVLEQGELREFDTPTKLLADPTSLFSMLRESATGGTGTGTGGVAAAPPPFKPPLLRRRGTPGSISLPSINEVTDFTEGPGDMEMIFGSPLAPVRIVKTWI